MCFVKYFDEIKITIIKGTYYSTNMEDSGSLTAFRRLDNENFISFNRIMVLRTASDFDQQYPG